MILHVSSAECGNPRHRDATQPQPDFYYERSGPRQGDYCFLFELQAVPNTTSMNSAPAKRKFYTDTFEFGTPRRSTRCC
jgi:hypothetical protein